MEQQAAQLGQEQYDADEQVVLEEEIDENYEPTESGAGLASASIALQSRRQQEPAANKPVAAVGAQRACSCCCRDPGVRQVARHGPGERKGKHGYTACDSKAAAAALRSHASYQRRRARCSHTRLLLQELLWIAREGLKAPLPADWKPWWAGHALHACVPTAARCNPLHAASAAACMRRCSPPTPLLLLPCPLLQPSAVA